MKMCKICRRKPRIERRVDSAGQVFYLDDCFDKFEDGPDDFSHLYIDDYEMLKIAYIDWMQNYEGDLLKWLAGSEGLVSEAIFFCIKELLGLQKKVWDWEVDERKYAKWL